MRMICFAAMYFGSLIGVATGQDLSVTQAGLLSRRQKACGMVFTVESTRQTKLSTADLQAQIEDRSFVEDEHLIRLKPTEFRETFALRFDPSDATNPYLSKWTCHSLGSHPLEMKLPFLRELYLIVDDGNRLLKVFRGTMDTADSNKAASLQRHVRARASILGRNYMQMYTNQLNHFFYVLTADTRQSDLPGDPTGERSEKKTYPLKFDGTVSVAGRTCERFVGRAEGKKRIDFEVSCLPSPDFAVASASTRVDGKLRRQLTIHKFDKFNDFVYPSEGSYETFEGHVETFPFLYSFRVVNVRTLADADISSWWPEPSEGTNTYDAFTEITTNTPYSSNMLQAFKMTPTIHNNTGSSLASLKQSRFRDVFIIASIAALLIFTGVIAYRRRRRRDVSEIEKV